jgi:hypothetical protein
LSTLTLSELTRENLRFPCGIPLLVIMGSHFVRESYHGLARVKRLIDGDGVDGDEPDSDKDEHEGRYAGRHTAINHLIISGAEMLQVSVLAGHGSQAFTQRVYGGDLDSITGGLGSLIDSQVTTRAEPRHTETKTGQPEVSKSPETRGSDDPGNNQI